MPLKITAFRNRQLLILSLGLGLIFFGFNAAEQHFSAFYQSIGLSYIAFQSLAILYASIIPGNFLGPAIVRKIGVKASLIIGFITYAAFIIGISLKIPSLIYFLSFLLGLGAGIAGIARVDFLRLVSPLEKRGEFTGATESIRTLGGFLGIIFVSLFLLIADINQAFIILGVIMFTGVGLLFLLKEINITKKEDHEIKNFKIMMRFMLDPKVYLLLPYAVSGGFLLGLVLGVTPSIIEKNFGIGWVGIITSFFHLTLAIVLTFAGYISDKKGRFILIYASLIISILAVAIFLNFLTIFSIILVMILLGLGGSLSGGAFGALMIDTFEEKVKEASAVLGNLGIILGLVPSFLLPQFLSYNQLFYLAIATTILGLICLRIFRAKYYAKISPH